MAAKEKFLTNKHKDLQKEEVLNRKINSILSRRLASGETTVLDWGCGRGAFVGALLLKGFDAYGVDVDKNVVDKSVHAFNELGFDSDNYLSVISENKIEKPSGYFDCIISEHVIEHLADFESFVEESGRLLRKGGFLYAVAPSKYCVIEPHLKMPIVHWLPDIFARYLVRLFVFFGVHPNWENVNDPVSEYTHYLGDKLHYKSGKSIKKILKKYGLNMQVVTQEHESFSEVVKKIPFKYVPKPFLSYLISSFYRIHFVAYKA